MVHCTNRQKHLKPLVYRSSQVYRDCTNSVPTVYQSSKTVKTQSKQQENDIGVPVVTCLPRLYQQCNNSLPIVNKNLAITNRSRVSSELCTQYVEGIHQPKYYTVTLKSRLRVTQGHWKRNHWTDHTRLTISRVI